jgi:hypothetical protein
MKTIIAALALVLLAACPTFATAATQDASALSESPSSREDTAVSFRCKAFRFKVNERVFPAARQDLPGYALIIEKSDHERSQPLLAVRVRLVLNPGQIAGLDSEEGRSINSTCSEGARTLLVDLGERDELIARQTTSLEHHSRYRMPPERR